MASLTFEDLLPELKDNIFEYFDVKDFLNLSLISHSWYDYIANSPMCMNKIRITINDYKEMTMESKELLKYSKRKYQHLYVGSCWKQTNMVIDMLCGPGHPWRIVHFSGFKFLENRDYEKCLSCIEETVQEIEFERVGIHQHTSFRVDYYFPNLKVLKFIHSDWSLNEPFMYSNQLKELYLMHNDAINNPEPFQRILTMNEGLKFLAIPGNHFESLVEEEVSDEIKFKLDKLTVSRIDYKNDYKPSQHNFNYFLKSQSKSIKKLNLNAWMGIEALATIFKHLTKLVELNMLNLEDFEETIEWDKVNFSTNISILKLNYKDSSQNFDIFDAIVGATPNIKTLTIFYLTQEMLDYSIYKVGNLEHLSAFFMDIREVKQKNILLKLKTFTGNVYDTRLQDSLSSKTKEKRSHFENLLFDNSYGRPHGLVLDNFMSFLKIDNSESSSGHRHKFVCVKTYAEDTF